jgi:hypothetical protein
MDSRCGVDPLNGGPNEGVSFLCGRNSRRCHQVQVLGEGRAVAAGSPSRPLWPVCLLGARSSEIVNREVRDLDRGGLILRILKATKTRAGKRKPAVPDVLKPHLQWLAHGKRPDQVEVVARRRFRTPTR